MSEYQYMIEKDRGVKGCKQTPLLCQRKPSSFKEIYLKSLQHKQNPSKQCCLCLFYSDDCSNFRCVNKSHYVCSECACDWQVDKLCPVCKRSSTASGRKDRLSMSGLYSEKLSEQKSLNELKDVSIGGLAEEKKPKSSIMTSVTND